MLFLLLALLQSSTPEIVGADRIDVGKFGLLSVSGVPAKNVSGWKFNPPVSLAPNQPRGSVCWTAPPGTYQLEVLIISGSSEVGYDITYLNKTLTVGAVVPPVPIDDPLTTAINAAYATENATTRKADASRIAGIYRKVAAAANTSVAANYADFYLDLTNAENAAGGIGTALPNVRNLMQTEVRKILPNSVASTAVSDQQKKAVSALANKFATVLEGLK